MDGPRDYVVVFERAETGGWGAWVPDLPGCFATGTTRQECEQRIREGIAFHIDGLRADGMDVPEPSAVDATVVHVDAA
ncbi:MAG: type II toxin-antitoxin system HicB family antitoxin [Pseudonocardia sp.]|nr:type II toxin-antitoxin system HicB family antitoxin [Pseudonocardia sp.]